MKQLTLEETKAFQARVAAVDLDKVSLVSTDRHIDRKQQAKLTRGIFKDLGLKGISVTTPMYSMACSVQVSYPQRGDYLIDGDSRMCKAHAANRVVYDKIMDVLLKAFPNSDNRSDSMTDYFDYRWSIN